MLTDMPNPMTPTTPASFGNQNIPFARPGAPTNLTPSKRLRPRGGGRYIPTARTQPNWGYIFRPRGSFFDLRVLFLYPAAKRSV